MRHLDFRSLGLFVWGGMKKELLGMLVTALSILSAAIVSGLRLKPYIDAGETYTPASFMLYPALAAGLVAIPVIFLLRAVQGTKEIEIGPLKFTERTPFMALWCILYIVIAVTFFPYDGPEESDLLPDPSHQEETESPLNQPVRLPFAVDPLQERSVEQRPTVPVVNGPTRTQL